MGASDAAQHKVAPFDVKTFQVDYLAPKGFYSPRSQQTPWQWVHPGTMADAPSSSLLLLYIMPANSHAHLAWEDAGTYLHFGMKKCCGDSKRKPCCCCGVKIPRCNKCEGSALVETNATYWESKVRAMRSY